MRGGAVFQAATMPAGPARGWGPVIAPVLQQARCARARRSRICTTPAAPSTISLPTHHMTATVDECRGARMPQQRTELTCPHEVRDDHRSVHQREEATDERVESRRKRQCQTRQCDSADGRGHPPGTRHRHGDQPERRRHRMMRVVPHRSHETVHPQPAEFPRSDGVDVEVLQERQRAPALRRGPTSCTRPRRSRRALPGRSRWRFQPPNARRSRSPGSARPERARRSTTRSPSARVRHRRVPRAPLPR